jgi:hypothetical protein
MQYELDVTNVSTDTCIERPQHEAGDWLKITTLCVLFVCGAVVNIFAYVHLNELPHACVHMASCVYTILMSGEGRGGMVGAGSQVHTWGHPPPMADIDPHTIPNQLHILKRHLNMSNMLVIFVYALSDLLWLLCYDWRAGQSLCRLVQFGRVFAFYASSNVIVCIALHRYIALTASSVRFIKVRGLN